MISFIAVSDVAVLSSEINDEPTDLEVPIDFLADESFLVEPESANESSDVEVSYAIRTKRAAGKAGKSYAYNCTKRNLLSTKVCSTFY